MMDPILIGMAGVVIGALIATMFWMWLPDPKDEIQKSLNHDIDFYRSAWLEECKRFDEYKAYYHCLVAMGFQNLQRLPAKGITGAIQLGHIARERIERIKSENEVLKARLEYYEGKQ